MSILKILKVTKEAYEAMLFDTYISWCMDWVDDYESELQKLVSYTPLNKWFQVQINKLEKPFIEENLPYLDVITPEVAREQYAEATNPIFKRFPKPLLEQARKPKPVVNDIYHESHRPGTGTEN